MTPLPARFIGHLDYLSAAKCENRARQQADLRSPSMRAGTFTTPNNLPVELTSFVGRERELAAVQGALGEHRLVTLTGAGGCGKTRLALRVAASAACEYPDGVRWVELAQLDDPELVPAALARVLGVPDSPLEPITDTVVRHLGEHRVLVGLDNCEHLIGACASLVARLLEGCPAITVLATSRERLGVPGESTWPVPPLGLPAGNDVVRSESVRLFVERARAARPALTVTDEDVGTIGEICTRLDGIPLAIELAAARTRLLSVQQIAAGLADRFRLLTGGARTTLPRQQTLEGSVDWSHALLDEDEPVVFRRLSVFAGSFTLEAAEAVCATGDIAASDVLDLLGSLVDRSLVQVVDDSGPQTRYRLLETIRDYARNKLAAASEADATRDRHLDFYVSFAGRADQHLQGPDLVGWLARVDEELPNLRVALDWSVQSDHSGQGMRLVRRLLLYWFVRGDLAVGRGRLEASFDPATDDEVDCAHTLIALCWIAYRGGDMVKAARHGDEAIAIGRRVGDDATLGGALSYRAVVRFWGDADCAGGWADFEEADALLRRTDDRLFRALNLGWLGQSLFDSSEAARARSILAEGAALTRAGGAVHARGPCLVGLALVDTFEGRLDEASAHVTEALLVAQELDDHYSEILARLARAFLSLASGRYRGARDHCQPGLATAVRHRSPNGEAFMRLALGWVAYAEADLEPAAAELEAAYQILAPLMPRVAALCRAYEANVAVAAARAAEAHEYAAEAVKLGEENDSVIALEWALRAQAALARRDGDSHRAEDLLHHQHELASRVRHRPFLCDALEALAGAITDQGRFEEAARLFGAAQAGRDTIGCVRFPVLRSIHEGDVAVVREELGAEPFDRAWTEGMALTIEDAVAYARRGRGRRRRPTHGWDSLTPTELQVVELVARGLTNPQIAERLFVSPRTVKAHLAHVFAKMAVSTRAQLAAIVAERRSTGSA